MFPNCKIVSCEATIPNHEVTISSSRLLLLLLLLLLLAAAAAAAAVDFHLTRSTSSHIAHSCDMAGLRSLSFFHRVTPTQPWTSGSHPDELNSSALIGKGDRPKTFHQLQRKKGTIDLHQKLERNCCRLHGVVNFVEADCCDRRGAASVQRTVLDDGVVGVLDGVFGVFNRFAIEPLVQVDLLTRREVIQLKNGIVMTLFRLHSDERKATTAAERQVRSRGHLFKLDVVVVAPEAANNLHEIIFVVVQDLSDVVTVFSEGGDAGSNRVGHVEVDGGGGLSN